MIIEPDSRKMLSTRSPSAVWVGSSAGVKNGSPPSFGHANVR